MKRYLITGASRGIGRAIAEELADADHTLLLHGRDRHALAKTCGLVEAKSGKATPLCYDLRQTDSIEKMIEEIGSAPIDVLINNAGLAVVKPVGEITLEEWETTLAVNVTAPFLLTQRLLRSMVSGSSIVNILSVAAKTGFPGWSCYCMSKFALEGFSQAVREELRPQGIRVLNCLSRCNQDRDLEIGERGMAPGTDVTTGRNRCCGCLRAIASAGCGGGKYQPAKPCGSIIEWAS